MFACNTVFALTQVKIKPTLNALKQKTWKRYQLYKTITLKNGYTLQLYYLKTSIKTRKCGTFLRVETGWLEGRMVSWVHDN